MNEARIRRVRFWAGSGGVGLLGVAGVALAAAACSDAGQPPAGGSGSDLAPVAEDPGATVPTMEEGEFVTYVADYEDGHSDRWHALRRADGSEVRVDIAPSPTGAAEPFIPATGSRVRLHGTAAGDRFHAFGVDPMEPLPQIESAPVLAAPPAQDTYALVLVDLGSGVDVDAAAGERAMFSTTPADKSFASYYFESSYGKYSITGAVVGPFPYSMTTCNTSGMAQTIEAANTAALAPYNHLIYYFPKTNLCTFGGLGEEGSQSKPAKRTWMNGSLSCVVLMQEPGHNIGLMHANTINCGTSSFTADASACTITEYGNTLTTMGSGCHQNNGYEKWYEQWLSGCNGVKVTSSGTFNLVPLGESCPGAVQVLQIPMPAPVTVNDPQATTTAVNLKNYYVELRAAAGSFDGYNATGRGGGAGGGVTFTGPTVTVYVSDDVKAGATTTRGGGAANSVWTELLNMNPGATPFTGLTTAGQSFAAPGGGPTITLQSISASGAVIGVTMDGADGGAPTCIDGTTLVGTGSACDGGAVVIPPFDAGTTLIDSGATARDAGVDAAAGPTDAGGARADASGGAAVDTGVGLGSAGMTGATSSSGGADGAAGASAAGNGGLALDGAANAAAPAQWGQGSSSGCGCETAGASGAAPRATSLALGALALVGFGWRRRRTARTRPATLGSGVRP